MFLKVQKVDVGCIQETKWKLSFDSVIRSLTSSRFWDWASFNAEGDVDSLG